METLAFILWVLVNGGWIPLVAFSDPDLCYAMAERGVRPTMCLLTKKAPWMYDITPKSMSFYLPRLEERV